MACGGKKRKSQGEAEHYPKTLVVENLSSQRQQILNDSLAGGMIGGYLETGFPFYFINRRMLSYLGYDREDEFISDIQGMLPNSIHPGDREKAVADAKSSWMAETNIHWNTV